MVVIRYTQVQTVALTDRTVVHGCKKTHMSQGRFLAGKKPTTGKVEYFL